MDEVSGQPPKNKWLKITIKADPQLLPSISDYLEGVLDAGVETAAKDEILYGTVNAYIDKANLSPVEVADIVSKVSFWLTELAEIFKRSTPTLSATMIDEEDWGKSWKKHFIPFAIVPGLVIAPTWQEYCPAAGEAVIVMDPGLAFGTGHHATTTLSVECLRQTLAKGVGQRLLDVGTGTGILGMAALLSGAAEVLAIDNDPEAVLAAEQNVRRNGLQERMQVSLAPLSTLLEPFDVVVANIVHDVLIGMVDDLSRLTAGGGNLILCGILAGPQAENIVAVFSAHDLQLTGRDQAEEWEVLCFGKRQSL